MSSNKSEQHAAGKVSVRQAENRTSANSSNNFLAWAALKTFLGGIFISLICSGLIEDFDTVSAVFAS